MADRARVLYSHFGERIQRMWFYGIIEISEKVELDLDGYDPLYSTGKILFAQKDVKISLNPKKTIDVGIYLMDYNALIGDADKRNETFLNIIQNMFKESVGEGED